MTTRCDLASGKKKVVILAFSLAKRGPKGLKHEIRSCFEQAPVTIKRLFMKLKGLSSRRKQH